MSHRTCPLCQSANTGASVIEHKRYTPDRGRLDIDYVVCHDCKTSWHLWQYIREDVDEIKEIRRGDGNRPAWGDRALRVCPRCKTVDHVQYEGHDGQWRFLEVEILRYSCDTCGTIWQEMTRISDGTRVGWRLWRAPWMIR